MLIVPHACMLVLCLYNALCFVVRFLYLVHLNWTEIHTCRWIRVHFFDPNQLVCVSTIPQSGLSGKTNWDSNQKGWCESALKILCACYCPTASLQTQCDSLTMEMITYVVSCAVYVTVATFSLVFCKIKNISNILTMCSYDLQMFPFSGV